MFDWVTKEEGYMMLNIMKNTLKAVTGLQQKEKERTGWIQELENRIVRAEHRGDSQQTLVDALYHKSQYDAERILSLEKEISGLKSKASWTFEELEGCSG